MNQLYSKTKSKKHLILWLILIFGINVLANDSDLEIDFNDHCKNSDAYILYSYTDVSYGKSWGSYVRQISYQSKLVINNKTGVDKFAFITLSKSVCDHLKSFQIKTLKSNGTIVELDSSQVFQYRNNTEHSDLINYPIPGVEPGDTVEISYMYTERLKEYELGDFVNLFNQVPSYNIEYSVLTTPDLTVRYKTYNGFPDPQVLANDTITYCLFKKEKVKGILENQYTCLPCELPYVYYSIEEKESDIRTWKDVYNQEFNYLTQPIKLDYDKSSYYRKWKRQVIGEAKDSSKYYKFNLLYEDILNNVQIEPIQSDEIIKPSGYFLKEKHLNPISIRRLYRQLLEDLEIKYWAVFARSKRLGDIDPYYIRKGEFDHIFFAYENNKGSLTLLYPHELSYKYQLDEIPTALFNTNAVIVKPYIKNKIRHTDKFIDIDLKTAEADSVTITMIKLPGMGANLNYLKQVLFCDVDLNNKNTSFKSNFVVSGGLSTDLRSFFGLLNKDEEMSNFYEALAEYEEDESALKIDTLTKIILKDKKPFAFSINAQGTFIKSVSFINDSLMSITLNNLIQHIQVDSEEDSIQLNYYLDYSFSDFSMLMFSFPCDIEMLSYSNYRNDFNNDFGEYLLNINQSGKNQLIINSNYRIIKDMIPKDNYEEIKQLNELVKETKNIRLLIKLL